MSIKLLALVSISRGKRWLSPTLKVKKSSMSLQELTVALTPCRECCGRLHLDSRFFHFLNISLNGIFKKCLSGCRNCIF